VQNEVEAQLVAQLVKALILGGVEESQIGIISLYRQQIKLLSHLIEPHKGVETLTADRSQGRDKDCIIISMCRSNDTNSIGDLLKDWRRLNVSFTRARSKLVIFGSRKTLSSSPLLGDFFELMERQSWIYQLPPGANVSHESGSGSGNRGIKRKRGETMLEAEDKENAVPLSRPSPRKKPRLESSKAGVGAGALLRGREMLRDVVMDLQML
jgi:DNA replication ATP-dependent helicase Dna2